MGQLAAVHHQTDQNLAAVPALAQENMAYKAGVLFFPIGGNAVGFHKLAHKGGDLIQLSGLQLAVGAGHDAMGAARVEACDHMALRIQPHRELDLVAVALLQRRGQDGQHRGIQSADAPEGILHKALLCPGLGLIVQMAEAAAAAGLAYRAIRLDVSGRGLQHLLHNGEGIAAQVLHDAGVQHITGGGGGHKHRLALVMGHTAAVAGKALDGQWDDGILVNGHKNAPFYSSSMVVTRPKGMKKRPVSSGCSSRPWPANCLSRAFRASCPATWVIWSMS